jgi:hypothetical protein
MPLHKIKIRQELIRHLNRFSLINKEIPFQRLVRKMFLEIWPKYKPVFESLFEVCEQKSLIWNGKLNEELVDIARKFLKSHGYKENK